VPSGAARDELLAPYTSLRVGGPAARLTVVRSDAQLVAALAGCERRDARSLLLLGGGTNVVVADGGFGGDVLVLDGGRIEQRDVGRDEVEFVVDAGASWDEFVAGTVRAGCAGVELLSGIPGRAGAAPIQNIAAYGQQVCDVITSIDVIDRETLAVDVVRADDARFGFRTSRFKHDWRDRFVVARLRLRLPRASAAPPEPSTYGDIERYFARSGGTPTDVADRRRAVLAVRKMKSMVLDPDDPDARSAGSFFLNPLVPAALADELVRAFASAGLDVEYLEGRRRPAEGWRRIPAAFVLRYSGFNAGDRWGPVKLSDKHVLAITTTDGATATDVWMLANHLRERAFEATGIELEYEPTFIGNFPEYDPTVFAKRYRYTRAAQPEPAWLAHQRADRA